MDLDPMAALLPAETPLTMEGFSGSDIIDFEPSLTAAYTFPMTADLTMTTLGPELTNLGLTNPSTVGEDLLEIHAAGRYVSLDYPRPDAEFLPSLSKTRSLTFDGKESARERRRTQNRFAQRAYRQRKEQAMKDQEKEIEALKQELEKEKKLNQTLAKVIGFLKERLNNTKQPKQETVTIITPERPTAESHPKK